MAAGYSKGRKRSKLSDRCPQCCGRAPIAPARSALTEDGTNIRSDYRCPGCGHAWSTCRLASAYAGWQS